jgi:pyruvate carboxylase subunit B
MALMSYQAACEAGVDILDCVFSPLSMGTSFPPVESVVAALDGTECDTGINLEALTEITPYFADIRKKYISILNPVSERVDVNVLRYQIPGGMLSNLVSQLKEQNALNRFEDVLKETPRVRKDLRPERDPQGQKRPWLPASCYTHEPGCWNTGCYECSHRRALQGYPKRGQRIR